MSDFSHGLGPDFMCVGAQKGGTQWLYDQLVFHPDFWMPPIKELHYLDRSIKKRVSLHQSKLTRSLDEVNESRQARGRRALDERGIRFVRDYIALAEKDGIDLDAYAHLFDEKGDLISGDVTGGYSRLRPTLIAKVMKRFPTVKVVFIARDPVERVWSQLSMRARRTPTDQRRSGKAELGYRRPLKEPVTASTIDALLADQSVASRSYPSKIVTRWRKRVPENQFGLFFFDHLRTAPTEFRRDVISFLGGDPSLGSGQFEAGFNRKSGLDKLVMTDEIRSALVRHFAQELKACAEVLGGPAADWPSRYSL